MTRNIDIMDEKLALVLLDKNYVLLGQFNQVDQTFGSLITILQVQFLVDDLLIFLVWTS